MENKVLHPAVTPVSEGIVAHEPQVIVDPSFTNGETKLSDDEITFFKENGFLVKRGFLNEPEAFERIRGYIWENALAGTIERDDPQTWLGAPGEWWTEEEEDQFGQIRGNSWKMRSRGGIGTEPFLLDKIANHPRMRKLVSCFTGEPVKVVQRARGVYITFPKHPEESGRLGPHSDHMASQVSAMVLVDDVRPNCGGFTIWPRSHLLLHPCWDMREGGAIGPDRAERYGEARDAVVRDITPVEFTGEAGDVIFWHPRMLHSPGINYSADHDKPVLRLIVPCDYQRADRTFFDDLEFGPGEDHQWWVDTRNFREDIPATEDNIWDGWAF